MGDSQYAQISKSIKFFCENKTYVFYFMGKKQMDFFFFFFASQVRNEESAPGQAIEKGMFNCT